MWNHKGDLITKESPSFTKASEVKTYLLLGTRLPLQFPVFQTNRTLQFSITMAMHFTAMAFREWL